MKTQTFTLIIETNEDGTSTMSSTNDGFAALDLLGALSFKVQDLCDQINGKFKPTKVKRKVIID